ncbi:hypothetical protein [Wolbachia endosymbiont (group B) of Camptogramma bilineatum]|uniref:hypothetical protein n=1 Tax=Wolbachia endosymbiont (group B) of Camptogramma bilineatum TaxID=2953991 RepID=UPI002231653F|nr:hypothetical protein [Wolbachia endosymbiont (group B) of Camptogramma bilineatum]
MVLKFFHEQIADLLSSNSSWVNPSQNHIKAARYLFDLGWIKMQERYYIVCSREEDRLDWPNVVDPSCSNEIFIDSDFDEACDDAICENCSRHILPNTYQKQRFHLLSIYLNTEKVIDWFETKLNDSRLMWEKVEQGVYYICNQGRIVNLIILDFCTDAIFLTIDKLRVHPTVLITLKKDIPNLLLNLYVVPMVKLFCQLKTVTEIFREAAKRGVPKVVENTSLQVLPASYISLKRVEPIIPTKLLELQVVKGMVYVNSIEVINKKAASCLIFFEYYLGNFYMTVRKNYHLKNIHFSILIS